MKNLRLFLINLSLILARFYHSLRITEKPVFLNLQETRQDISSETVDVDSNTDLGERRRSVRAKRDKPDYYDALDYESKRQKTPRSEKKKISLPTRASVEGSGKMKRYPVAPQNTGRATLTWRKGEEEDTGKKKKQKPGAQAPKKEDTEEVGEPTLEEIPQDKVFPCAVSLAEINRKLGLVMWKPVST
ncbi:uncharacterized protein LOC111709737 [Eurytemora carolleeae]|uniref:uncharacterized protein LOC111709737 n=1 Tax=Eurytemora carolleeae TaxID=1294199 RepID=UPI000C78D719|nr:uncharacterized protein LOC111709737 [Eurytemora carolleeae]|eukprot:XP_023339400.1 uncharacterized protein LOC111709737 [Eurytemora affinis]